jgi:hypothetical protein
MTALVQLSIQLGLPSALVIFFVWYAQKREEKLSSRVADLEKEYRTILIDLIRQTDVHLERHTSIIVELVEGVKESNKQVTTLLTQMGDRPCLLHSHKD